MQFRHGDLAGLMHSILLESGLSPHRLEVEITESVLFGDFSKYYIRDAGDIEIIRLNERYADAYATGFLAVRRTDAKVAQSAAIKKLTQPAS